MGFKVKQSPLKLIIQCMSSYSVDIVGQDSSKQSIILNVSCQIKQNMVIRAVNRNSLKYISLEI